MKECPRCSLCQDDDTGKCPYDGERLVEGFPGNRLIDGKYRVDRRLGEGGMGLIYQVRHLALQRNFALKVIKPREAADPMFLARFRLEAEALGRLKHPNIVDITDFGVDSRQGGLPYLVMEYLEGVSLADLLRREGSLGPQAAIPILESIGRAVDFAHAQGVLHRDLKPGNVFICERRLPEESVKVLDFGLARILGPSDSAHASLQTTLTESLARHRNLAPASQGLTSTGAIVGTILYMSPEVVREQPATPASDIYSLGVVAYALLVGRTPYQGTPEQVLVGHVREEPPVPSTLQASIPREFDAPLLAALEKTPARRPPRAADFAASLRAAAAGAELSRWRRIEIPRRAWISAAAGVVLIAVSALLWRSSPIQALERKAVDARFLAVPARDPDPRIFLVSIDDATLEADSTPLSQKADEFGRELDRAFTSGAKAIAVDLLLPASWSSSQTFSELVVRHAPALTLAALSSASGAVVGPECVGGFTAAALGPAPVSELFGAVNLMEDPDGVVRRARLFYRDRAGGERRTWAARAAGTFSAAALQMLRRRAGDSPFWINYAAARERFQRISWKDLASRIDQDPRAFEGRLLLVGGDFAGGGDDAHAVPYRPEGAREVSGLVLQALIVNTLLEGVPFRGVSSSPILMAAGLAAGCIVFMVLTRKSLLLGTAIATAVAISYLAIAVLVFRQSGQVLPTAGPIVTLGLAVVAAAAMRGKLPRRPNAEVNSS